MTFGEFINAIIFIHIYVWLLFIKIMYLQLESVCECNRFHITLLVSIRKKKCCLSKILLALRQQIRI